MFPNDKYSLSCVGTEVLEIGPTIFGSDFIRNRDNYKFLYQYLKKPTIQSCKKDIYIDIYLHMIYNLSTPL
jgi:hypothetical protein